MGDGANSILRPATGAAALALQRILHDTFDLTCRPNITEDAALTYVQGNRPSAYIGSRGLLFWVVEIDREVVGFIDWDGDFINALHVRSTHARQGIGRRLMDYAGAEIARAGFPSVRLETGTFNVRSQAFYAARDYRGEDRYPDEEWASGLTTILLVKRLA